MAGLTAHIRVRGIPQFKRNVRTVKKAALQAALEHADRESELLFEGTTRIVPYMSGRLFNSAYRRKRSTKEENPVFVVGYNLAAAPHGWAVHQIPNRNHPTRGPYSDPKTDHFLTIPRDALALTYAARATVRINRAIQKARVERVR